MDTAHFPCPSILGFSGHSGHPNIILGWTQSTHFPCLSILGFPRHSATSRSSRDGRCSPPYRGIDTSMTYVAHLPLSEYPGIPWRLRSVQYHRGVDTAHSPLSEYPGIPRILRPTQDHRGMDRAYHPPYPIYPMWGYPGIPGILRPSQDHPGMDRAYLSMSEYPGIPKIL